MSKTEYDGQEAIEEVEEREQKEPRKEHDPSQLFVAMCCAVHNVVRCDECFNFQGGDCTFYRMGQKAAMEDGEPVAEA